MADRYATMTIDDLYREAEAWEALINDGRFPIEAATREADLIEAWIHRRRIEGQGEPLSVRLHRASAGFLWAVHVIGPDDMFPARNYLEALQKAEAINEGTIDVMEDTGVASVAVPALWPGTAEEHAAALAENSPRKG